MQEGMHLKFNKYLNKKDPIDNAILELIKEDKLKIGFVKVGNENTDKQELYSRHNLAVRAKHTS